MFSCVSSLSNLIRYCCLLVPDARLLTDPDVHNMILLQIPICGEVNWDNLAVSWFSCAFLSLSCIHWRGWESHGAGSCPSEEQVLAWEHSSAEHFIPCGVSGDWGWEQGCLEPNTYPSASNCAQWETNKSFRQYGGQKKMTLSECFFLVLVREKILWDEREEPHEEFLNCFHFVQQFRFSLDSNMNISTCPNCSFAFPAWSPNNCLPETPDGPLLSGFSGGRRNSHLCEKQNLTCSREHFFFWYVKYSHFSSPCFSNS